MYQTGRREGTRGILAAALVTALGSSPPAAAAEWEWGEFTARIDSFAAVSMSMRTESPDCKLTAIANSHSCSAPDLATQGALLNADDGNQNWKKGRPFSALLQGTHEVDLRWRNLGAFVRTTWFADAIQGNEVSSRRTDLDHDARFRDSVLEGGVVGAQFLLLDAYLRGAFEVRERNVELRLGNQVVNWGESLFTQGALNSTNTLDVSRLRLAGAELRDALLPAPIGFVAANVVGDLSLEAYYQFGWRQTQVDPVGSFFSISDLVGRGAQGFFTPVGPGDPGASGLSRDEIFDLGFAFGGAPRLRDREADNQGQGGVALRYYIDALETEIAAYYMRQHDKLPSVSFVGECPAGTTGAPCLLAPRVIGYYREFPDNIDVVGLSFASVVAGVSFAGEVSYRRDQPTPIASALPDLTNSILAGASGGDFHGFVREERILGLVNALYVAGPGTRVLGRILTWLRAADSTLIGEVAVQSYPDLSNRVAYAAPLGETEADDLGVSYTLRVDASYPRAFGSSIGLKPIVTFRHDAYGVLPGNGALFTEGVKAVALQLEANYQERWTAVVGYQNNLGAGRGNPYVDRDFVSMRITYAF